MPFRSVIFFKVTLPLIVRTFYLGVSLLSKASVTTDRHSKNRKNGNKFGNHVFLLKEDAHTCKLNYSWALPTREPGILWAVQKMAKLPP